MEDVLDEIARGEAERVPWLRRFYFGDGDGDPGLKSLVGDIGDIDAREVSSFPLAGSDIVVRVGRYGPYLERDGQRVNVPEGTAPDELTPERAAELFDQPIGDVPLGTDPASGHQIVAKSGRFGPYVTEVLLDGETVTVQNGRYGPYVKKGTDSRSLENEDQLFTLGLAEAKEMFAQPKAR